MVKASDAPIAAVAASASPSAEVSTDGVCLAVTSSFPPRLSAPTCVPIELSVVMFEMAIATTGVIARLPVPSTPPSAPTFIESVASEATVRSDAPLNTASFARPAVVLLFVMARPTEAPMPRVEPPVPCGLASTVVERSDVLLRETDVAPESVPALRRACFFSSPIATARAPAMPTEAELPPAPATEVALNDSELGVVA